MTNDTISGVSDSPLPDCLALRSSPRGGRKARFSSLVVQVKALACELPYTLGLLIVLSVEEIRQHVISQGLVAEMSGALCGAGSAAMPFAPGNIEAGSFLAIRTLPQKPYAFSIFTNVSGGRSTGCR